MTRAKTRVSRATGIPWTRSGRQRKIGAAVGGCALPSMIVVVLCSSLTVLIVR